MRRLSLLLPWLNERVDPYSGRAAEIEEWAAEGHRVLTQFIASFDGSADVHGDVVGDVTEGEQPLDAPHVEDLQIEVQLALHAAVDGVDGYLGMPSLAVGVKSGGRIRQVSGTRHDVTLYLVHLLLTTDGVVDVLRRRRCPAPSRDGQLPFREEDDRVCGRWLVQQPTGQWPKYCDAQCRRRYHESKQREVARAERQRYGTPHR